MIELAELRSLPVQERLQLVEALWDTIAQDQESLTDPSGVSEELRRRKTRFQSSGSAGIPWEKAKERIRGGLA